MKWVFKPQNYHGGKNRTKQKEPATLSIGHFDGPFVLVHSEAQLTKTPTLRSTVWTHITVPLLFGMNSNDFAPLRKLIRGLLYAHQHKKANLHQWLEDWNRGSREKRQLGFYAYGWVAAKHNAKMPALMCVCWRRRLADGTWQLVPGRVCRGQRLSKFLCASREVILLATLKFDHWGLFAFTFHPHAIIFSLVVP